MPFLGSALGRSARSPQPVGKDLPNTYASPHRCEEKKSAQLSGPGASQRWEPATERSLRQAPGETADGTSMWYWPTGRVS